jgi:hypothetical protein
MSVNLRAAGYCIRIKIMNGRAARMPARQHEKQEIR